jgi:hypothetical protein
MCGHALKQALERVDRGWDFSGDARHHSGPGFYNFVSKEAARSQRCFALSDPISQEGYGTQFVVVVDGSVAWRVGVGGGQTRQPAEPCAPNLTYNKYFPCNNYKRKND